MANIDSLEEWSLTPDGWVRNSVKSRGVQRDTLEGVPSERLLTIQEWEYAGNQWSSMTGSCRYSFISSDVDKLSEAISKYGSSPGCFQKRFDGIDPAANADKGSMDICDTKRDSKTGEIRDRFEDGQCGNCDGAGATGKDKTGDDFPCPKCGGSGKSYIWRPKK